MSADEGSFDRSDIQAEVPVDSDDYAHGAKRRFRVTLDFIDSLPSPVLDMGPPNALAREVQRRFGVTLENTGTHDLDRERLDSVCPGPYAAITSFEVLEHVMNPLFVLDGCRAALRPDGALYISVPRRHPWEWLFGKSPEHFHEFAQDELVWLIEKAGFRVERLEMRNSSEMGFGVRPVLRRLFRNLILVECRPR